MTVLIIAILMGAVGQIALKAGINQLGVKPSPGVVLRSIVSQWQVSVGFICYGLSSLLYLLALSRLEVSYAYPMVALSYVVVTFLSWRFLGEVVPRVRIGGLALICIGVIVVALSFRPQSAKLPPVPPPAQHLTDNGVGN